MDFNYLKTLKIVLVFIGFFLIVNYVSIPMMGMGSTIGEIIGAMILLFGSMIFIDILKRIYKIKKTNENKN